MHVVVDGMGQGPGACKVQGLQGRRCHGLEEDGLEEDGLEGGLEESGQEGGWQKEGGLDVDGGLGVEDKILLDSQME